MDKLDIVKNYYQSWVKEDIEALESYLYTPKFGIRNFFEDLLFSIKDIKTEFNKYKVTSFSISNFDENDKICYYDIVFEYIYKDTPLKVNVSAKILFENSKIIRVYELLYNPKNTRVKCIVSYDGSAFYGFQKQPNERTVQGDIEKGLKYLTKEDITIHSSGRTDKGVHALNQVFHFDTLSKIDPNDFWRVLRSYLPDTIYIKSSSKVQNTFHSRYDVVSKEYMYVINYKEYDPIKRNYEWFVDDFDIDLFTSELNKIVGTHDFSSFTKAIVDREKIRKIINVKIEKTNSHLYVSIIGKGFLRYMVRYLIGTLMEISMGNTELSIIDYINLKNPSEVKWKAPGGGLYLKEVIHVE